MPRKAVLLKSLTRGRIRASFNKYNLFNLYKKGPVDFRTKSLYQQKWSSKQETRAYHGEHLTEGRWQTLFDSKLNSVAQLDASLRTGKDGSGPQLRETPYLLQTYAALEKRLDFALFRAMFASSIRQARQFILHGNVKVNGVKIKHPGFVLKPGDTFQVNSNKVLEALGAKKPSLEEAIKVDKKQILLWNMYVKKVKANPRQAWRERIAKFQSMPETNPRKQEFEEWAQRFKSNVEKNELNAIKCCTPKNLLFKILRIHKSKPDEATTLSATDFQTVVDKEPNMSQEVFRCYNEFLKSDEINWKKLSTMEDSQLSVLADNLLSFTPEMKKNLADKSKTHIRAGTTILSSLVKNYSLALSAYFKTVKNDISANNIPYDPSWAAHLQYHKPVDFEKIKECEQRAKTLICLPWQKGHLWGRADPKKSYFTPWKPRQFLAPFAILPHHIEVSFKTCTAIYLRDPVARPGHSEVITPFDMSVHERAYMYYVRKGK
ncbi:mitochondrial 37S ribosomal protein uS4m KNAG_0I02300 [Huiozyma naganishii CBS 8797]|uniref:Small ribosomal subunit protein uS4m n=1 Tax=Huiozyma naganishii (strain ATCC MYA-139 / BCRC 22969 / CBS 8797 / KCTC 17520 / NBRC 10181 / NCYC 3082 / Yp74L-3) TaxID=1071383 RepID=J7SAB6_HUIN7|nr:hypothetical protein KNAG_0I02300 [Kazachstania naganishii CBS 8797]CCK72016.1 hypothetical protein KNAG_0I02300 [Kazachstania naganishii CBS 8797]